MSIRTILFDLDGTLIDTNDLIMASFRHTFQRHNMPFTTEDIIEFNGPPLQETFRKIDPNRVDELIATYREHNFAHHDNYVKPFPHVVDTVKQLKKQNLRLGVVTTKLQKTAKMGISITGMDGLFETMITTDDVTNTKPHPEPVLKAMEHLNADPSSTLMIGDNHHDIEAGHNAGILTAGVVWSQKGAERLKQYNPTYMIDDIRDLFKIVGV
ncbi:pyrophosphatase PpaX [Oceanobacillus halotolerans]|uniref:pyrophosphatase PpaX n=1 Tax=Oceanobacillus halotolerans TaxID=2663380 RepID=UPI0013DCDFD6|nr:pyrophosphatase PpaX [Oceanobacillus halotolerans]